MADEKTRTLRENALLHAMITYIAKHHEWAGKKRSPDVWKRLLVASWCRAHNENIEMLPALDGNGFDIVYRKTSRLTVAECASLIEWIYAWGSENDVHFPADPKQVADFKPWPEPNIVAMHKHHMSDYE